MAHTLTEDARFRSLLGKKERLLRELNIAYKAFEKKRAAFLIIEKELNKLSRLSRRRGAKAKAKEHVEKLVARLMGSP